MRQDLVPATEISAPQDLWVNLVIDRETKLRFSQFHEPLSDPSQVDIRRCELRKVDAGTSGVYVLLQREEPIQPSPSSGSTTGSTTGSTSTGEPASQPMRRRLQLMPRTKLRPVAIYKPADEEAADMREGFQAGEGVFRELAAYLLDHEHFAGVPQTIVLAVRKVPDENQQQQQQQGVESSQQTQSLYSHNTAPQVDASQNVPPPKNIVQVANYAQLQISHQCLEGLDVDKSDKASQAEEFSKSKSSSEENVGLAMLQDYVQNIGLSEDYSDSRFSKRSVHAIALLDLRLVNVDRNAANLLVSAKDPSVLIPIDHEFVLPPPNILADEDVMENAFSWANWAAVDEPFDMETLRYILRLDVKKDAEILRLNSVSLQPNAMMTLRLTTMLIKIAAFFGLSLREIVQVFMRRIDPYCHLLTSSEQLENLSPDKALAHRLEAAHLTVDSGSELGSECNPNDSGSDVDYSSNANSTLSGSSPLSVISSSTTAATSASAQPASPTSGSTTESTLPPSSDSSFMRMWYEDSYRRVVNALGREVVEASSFIPPPPDWKFEQTPTHVENRLTPLALTDVGFASASGNTLLQQIHDARPDWAPPSPTKLRALAHLVQKLDVGPSSTAIDAVARQFLFHMSLHMLDYAESIESPHRSLLSSGAPSPAASALSLDSPPQHEPVSVDSV